MSAEKAKANAEARQLFVDRYGIDPLDAGIVGKLADHECPHGRLEGDETPVCGCFEKENAAA